jgi:hypothetical protein
MQATKQCGWTLLAHTHASTKQRANKLVIFDSSSLVERLNSGIDFSIRHLFTNGAQVVPIREQSWEGKLKAN